MQINQKINTILDRRMFILYKIAIKGIHNKFEYLKYM
jgi:hypothetical protein